MTRNSQIKLAGAAVVAILMIIHLADPSPANLWLRVAYDSLHVPLFGIIAVCVLFVAPARWGIKKRLVVTACTVFGLSVLSEAAQIPINRDASLQDLVADWAGAAGFLCIAVAWCFDFPVSRLRALFLTSIGVALLAWPLMPLAQVTAAYLEREHILPSLTRFESRRMDLFFRLNDARLVKHRDKKAGPVSAEIVLQEGRWPGIAFQDIWPAWQDYSALIVEIENPEPEQITLIIRVNDRDHHQGEQRHSDRFNKRVELAPGAHTMHIALADIENAPETRRMNMLEIKTLIIFATRQSAGRRFIIHSIRLE